ncbi:MAG: membrane protein insertase YidC [Candidatus Cloacimonetes bacterium]|nr:membrane protein insertase YidC [Candidatus Cloacimonadota bacterium]
MDKNTVWAFILILAVFWLSSEFLWKPAAKEAETGAITESATEHAIQDSIPVNQAKDILPATTAYIDNLTDLSQDIAVNDAITLSNEKVKFSFTNRGARINGIVLNDYQLADNGGQVNLIREQGTAFGLELSQTDGNMMLGANYIYDWDVTESQVTFTATSSAGKIEKRFILREDYQLEMELVIESNQERFNYSLLLDDGIADTEKYLKHKNQNYQTMIQVDNKIKRDNLGRLKKQETLTGAIDWAALRSKFFLIGIVKDELSDWNSALVYSNEGTPAMRIYGSSSRFRLESNFRIYAGPVIQDNLEKLGSGFGDTYYAGNGIFFGQGIIKPVSRFFGWIFKQFHKVLPNWGMCLVLFSILIKIILYPLTHKSFESNQKMQKVQPQVTAVREKYKGDPQKMNAEMQRLYRENGVSPLGGCLPMLLQMPIFFALYPVVRYSIDLRQAGFLWLRDLSEPDPYLILPILMGVFMFLQQALMQPTKEARAQMTEQQQAQMQSQKMMMYIMPVMMFFLFKSFPAGLVLYWTLFNIMSTIQQRIIRNKFS